MFEFVKRKKMPEKTLINWKSLDKEEIIKRSKILIIDDDPFPLIELFVNDEYNIKKWSGKIERIDQIEQGYYDLILLDFHGVGTELSDKQGIGVLEHIKNINPSQLVVAISNKEWGMEYQKFIELADSKMSKRESYVEFKREIDQLLKKRFSKDYYLNKILEISEFQDKDKYEEFFNKSLNDGRIAKNHIPSGLSSINIDRIVKITEQAINIYTMLKNLHGGE